MLTKNSERRCGGEEGEMMALVSLSLSMSKSVVDGQRKRRCAERMRGECSGG